MRCRSPGSNAVSSARHRTRNSELVSQGRSCDDSLQRGCHRCRKATIKHPNEGAKLPNAAFFGGMGHAALLGTTSLGHIIGIGAIQGLAARGVL